MTKITKSQRAKRNKTMGSNAERYYRKKFENIGFSKCVTSRLGSRLHDNAGIDLINIPFNLQIKAGLQTGLNVAEELRSITTKVDRYFPKYYPEHNQPNLVLHKKFVGKGKRRTKYDEIVSMTFKDFIDFFVKPIYGQSNNKDDSQNKEE